MLVNPGGHRKSSDNENQRGKDDLLFWNAEFYITEAYSESWAGGIAAFGNHALSCYLKGNFAAETRRLLRNHADLVPGELAAYRGNSGYSQRLR